MSGVYDAPKISEKSGDEAERSSNGRSPSTTFAALVGVILCAASLGLYVSTLAPTILYYDLPELRDSAVLQTRAYVLGIPDYTGYPTYIMLAHLFTYLPFGDPAYRVNLASAVYASATVALVFACGFVLTRRIIAPVAAAAAFALGGLFWSQAVIAEVYTLNAVLVAVCLFLLLLWGRSRRDRYLLASALLAGLSLTNHITSGLVVLGAGVLILFTDRSKFLDWRLILKGAGLFVLGLLPYVYIPVRSSMDFLPEGFVWGQPAVRRYPPDTLYGFYNLVSGGEWKERMWAFGPSELPGRISMYLDYLYGSQGQFAVWLVLVGVVGGFYLAYRRPAEAAFLGFLYFGWLFYALEYNIEDIEYYFIPTFIVLCILMAVGFSAVLDAIERLLPAGDRVAQVGVFIISCGFVLLAFVGVGEKYRASDMSGDYRGREIMDAVEDGTLEGATVLHHRSPLDYMILVEGRRPDLKLVPYLEEKNPYKVAKGIFESQKAPTYVLFPGYASTPYYTGVERSRLFFRYYGYDLIPVDRDVLLYRVLPRNEAER